MTHRMTLFGLHNVHATKHLQQEACCSAGYHGRNLRQPNELSEADTAVTTVHQNDHNPLSVCSTGKYR